MQNVDGKRLYGYYSYSRCKAVYVAYRQANMVDYISFDEFIDKWDFDMEVAVAVYSTMMFKQARDAYQKNSKSK